jgi:hypothetical protein
MIDLVDDLVIKVECREDEDPENFVPINMRILKVCNEIERLGIFEYAGKSRIDGNPLYIIIKGMGRSLKINKILGKEDKTFEKIQDFLNKYDKSIQVLHPLDFAIK